MVVWEILDLGKAHLTTSSLDKALEEAGPVAALVLGASVSPVSRGRSKVLGSTSPEGTGGDRAHKLVGFIERFKGASEKAEC